MLDGNRRLVELGIREQSGAAGLHQIGANPPRKIGQSLAGATDLVGAGVEPFERKPGVDQLQPCGLLPLLHRGGRAHDGQHGVDAEWPQCCASSRL